MSERTFKPNLAFLEKVRAGKVERFRGYTMRRGGYDGFRGGEATYQKHYKAGFVNYCGSASLGRPAKVTLTEKGDAALAARKNAEEAS